MILLYILLVIIAYILWRIYRQKEDEKEVIANEKADAEYKHNRKEKFKDYPYLFEKIDDSWIQVFDSQVKNGIPLLKIMFILMVHESTKIDYSDGSLKYDSLWNATKELL